MAGTPTFRIDRTRAGTGQTITLAGELDSGTCRQLIDAFERAASELEAGEPEAGEPEAGELRLDLSELSFIDSAGLRAIIQLERTARERGLALVVVPAPEPVTALLALTGVAARLTLTSPPSTQSFVERIELELPSDLSAPRRARAEVREAAGELLPQHALDSAILLTSELVTNAVIHPPRSGEHRVGLRITTYEHGIRCEITDAGPGFDPANPGRRSTDTGGRGLMLVDALSSRWGVNRASERGKERFCVWFEVAGSGSPEPAAAAARGT